MPANIVPGRKAGQIFTPGRNTGLGRRPFLCKPSTVHRPPNGTMPAKIVRLRLASLLMKASLAFGELVLRLAPGKQRPLRKSVAERFAALTREEREKKPVILSFRTTHRKAGLMFLSVQRIFWARSRAGASRDDQRGAQQGNLKGRHSSRSSRRASGQDLCSFWVRKRKQLQVTRCRLNKKMAVRYRSTVLR